MCSSFFCPIWLHSDPMLDYLLNIWPFTIMKIYQIPSQKITKVCSIVCQTLNKSSIIDERILKFAKVAQFCQIWSHWVAVSRKEMFITDSLHNSQMTAAAVGCQTLGSVVWNQPVVPQWTIKTRLNNTGHVKYHIPRALPTSVRYQNFNSRWSMLSNSIWFYIKVFYLFILIDQPRPL